MTKPNPKLKQIARIFRDIGWAKNKPDKYPLNMEYILSQVKKNFQIIKKLFLTLRRQNVNFFTIGCVRAVLAMKELPQAPGTTPYPPLKFYDESDFHTFESKKSTEKY